MYSIDGDKMDFLSISRLMEANAMKGSAPSAVCGGGGLDIRAIWVINVF